MTIAIGGNNISAVYVGSKPVQKIYKGSQLIWSTKFKVDVIISTAISTRHGPDIYGTYSYSLDTSKAGWTSGNYDDHGNTIYTFPNFPIYKLPNGIKLRFWNSTYGVRDNTTSISASDIAKGVDTIVNDYTYKNINTRVQMNGKNLEIIAFTNAIELYRITAY